MSICDKDPKFPESEVASKFNFKLHKTCLEVSIFIL